MSEFADVKDVDGLSAEALEIERLRHTAAHVMAQAVRRFWPDTSLAIGPTVEGGFYYDMVIPEAITQEHLAKLETEMRKIAKENLPLVRAEISKDEARRLFSAAPFKLEIIEGIPGDSV